MPTRSSRTGALIPSMMYSGAEPLRDRAWCKIVRSHGHSEPQEVLNCARILSHLCVKCLTRKYYLTYAFECLTPKYYLTYAVECLTLWKMKRGECMLESSSNTKLLPLVVAEGTDFRSRVGVLGTLRFYPFGVLHCSFLYFGT